MISACNYLRLNGSNQYGSIPRSIQDNFTIEFWFRSGQGLSTNTSWPEGAGLVDMECAFVKNDFGTNLNANGQVMAGIRDMSINSGATAYNNNAWHHVAFVRDKTNTTIKLYIDGELKATQTGTSADSLTEDSTISIGKVHTDVRYYCGDIAEVRLWNTVRTISEISSNMDDALVGNESGLVSLYQFDSGTSTLTDNTANTNDGTLYNTPTIRNTDDDFVGHVDDTYTKLLMHMEVFDTATGFYDEAGHTIVTNGGATINSSVKKFGEGSACFDGDGDYLSAVNSIDFRFGTGDFTIDFWLYSAVAWTSQPSSCGIAGQKSGDGSSGWVLYRDGGYADKINGRIGGSNNFPTGSTPTQNTWEHWALVRSGTSLKWYKNGVLDASTTNSTDINDTGGTFLIARSQTWSGHLNGYIDELRISKGIARWTEDFTPPTAPYEPETPAASTRRRFVLFS